MTDRPPIRLSFEADLQALRSLPLLQPFPDPLLEALRASSQLVHFGAEERIFRAGDPLGELHYLISGEIGITRPRLEGKEEVVDVVSPVRPLCLSAVLLGQPTPVGARALTVGRLITLSGSQLREMIPSDLRLAQPFFDYVLRDAYELASAHYVGRMRTAPERLADYLLGLIKDPEEKPARLILPLQSKQIAMRLGITPSVMTDALARLQRWVGVQVQYPAVVVPDVAALVAYAHSSGHPTKRRPGFGRPRKLAVIDGGRGAPPPLGTGSAEASRADSPTRVKPTRVKPICKVPGCGKHAHARGYCAAHYSAQYVKALPVCKVPGCTKRSHSRGYCLSHYHKLLWHGDPTKDARVPQEDGGKGASSRTPEGG